MLNVLNSIKTQQLLLSVSTYYNSVIYELGKIFKFWDFLFLDLKEHGNLDCLKGGYREWAMKK